MDQEKNTQEKDLTMDEVAVERFKKLPKVIQDTILKSGWQNIIRDLTSQYKLRVDQGTQLENMVFSLMLGMTESDEFFKFIMEDLELDEEKAISLFKDVDYKIFTNIYQGIVKSGQYPIKDENEVVEKNSPQNFLKDNVINASKEDEILTVTRDEILRGIEDPEDIVDLDSNLPDLEDTKIMPKPPVSTQNSSIEIKEKEIPSNLPTSEPETSEEKPIDPISAGLNSTVSTSAKNYKESDPYRESIK